MWLPRTLKMQICTVNQNYGALILFEHSKHFLELVCPGTQFGECCGLIILPFKKLQDQITCYWRKYYKPGWGDSNIQWISALGQICLVWFKFYFSKEHLHCILLPLHRSLEQKQHSSTLKHAEIIQLSSRRSRSWGKIRNPHRIFNRVHFHYWYLEKYPKSQFYLLSNCEPETVFIHLLDK